MQYPHVFLTSLQNRERLHRCLVNHESQKLENEAQRSAPSIPQVTSELHGLVPAIHHHAADAKLFSSLNCAWLLQVYIMR